MERGHDGKREQAEQHGMGQARPQPQRGRLALVEGEGDERPVPEHGDGQGDAQRHPEVGQVRRPYGEHVPEEEPRQVHGERLRPRDDDHAQREHADEEHADPGVLGEPR